MNGKFWKTLMALLVAGFIGNTVVTWRTVDVLKNEVEHLTAAVEKIERKVDNLTRFVLPDPR